MRSVELLWRRWLLWLGVFVFLLSGIASDGVGAKVHVVFQALELLAPELPLVVAVRLDARELDRCPGTESARLKQLAALV